MTGKVGQAASPNTAYFLKSLISGASGWGSSVVWARLPRAFAPVDLERCITPTRSTGQCNGPCRFSAGGIRFHNRRSMGQPDGTAIRHKQPVPQCTPRLDLIKLFEAALRHTAGCFFRHLLTCLTIATGIGRYIVFAYPLTLLRKFPAVSAGQSG